MIDLSFGMTLQPLSGRTHPGWSTAERPVHHGLSLGDKGIAFLTCSVMSHS